MCFQRLRQGRRDWRYESSDFPSQIMKGNCGLNVQWKWGAQGGAAIDAAMGQRWGSFASGQLCWGRSGPHTVNHYMNECCNRTNESDTNLQKTKKNQCVLFCVGTAWPQCTKHNHTEEVLFLALTAAGPLLALRVPQGLEQSTKLAQWNSVWLRLCFVGRKVQESICGAVSCLESAHTAHSNM